MLVELITLIILIFFPIISYHIYDKFIKIEPKMLQTTIIDHQKQPNWNFVLCPYNKNKCLDICIWTDLDNLKNYIILDIFQECRNKNYESILSSPVKITKQCSKRRLHLNKNLYQQIVSNTLLIQTSTSTPCQTPIIIQFQFVQQTLT